MLPFPDRLLGRRECVKVEPVLMTEHHEVFVDGVLLSADECNALAYRDGFRDLGPDRAFEEMLEFWKGRPLPFEGVIVHWKAGQ